jgi:hypothetical protein
MLLTVNPPGPTEYPEYFNGYIARVAHDGDAVATLERQRDTMRAWAHLSPDQASHRYAPDKWTVKEVIGHIIDAERIFDYRLLRIARGDRTPLAPFDENAYVQTSNAGSREIGDLVAELLAVRESTLGLVRSLDEPMLSHVGTLKAGDITARGQVFVIAGHFAHHAAILKERYGV